MMSICLGHCIVRISTNAVAFSKSTCISFEIFQCFSENNNYLPSEHVGQSMSALETSESLLTHKAFGHIVRLFPSCHMGFHHHACKLFQHQSWSPLFRLPQGNLALVEVDSKKLARSVSILHFHKQDFQLLGYQFPSHIEFLNSIHSNSNCHQ